MSETPKTPQTYIEEWMGKKLHEDVKYLASRYLANDPVPGFEPFQDNEDQLERVIRENYRKRFGYALSIIRQERGIVPGTFAEKLDMTIEEYAAYENGELVLPDPAHLRVWAYYLGLLDGDVSFLKVSGGYPISEIDLVKNYYNDNDVNLPRTSWLDNLKQKFNRILLKKR